MYLLIPARHAIESHESEEGAPPDRVNAAGAREREILNSTPETQASERVDGSDCYCRSTSG